MAVARNITFMYNELMAGTDPRVTSLPLMQSPVPVVLLTASYILFVKFLGPIWMKNKKPFDLRYIMFLYNISLVFVTTHFLYQGLGILLNGKKSLLCRVEDVDDPDSWRLAELGWTFMFLKLVEFADTIFFVLRKKCNQISALHVFHHSVTPLACWTILRLDPGGYNYFVPLINSMVHVVMYTYYGLAALGPSVRKYLWWKKYLTTMQLVQFVLIILYIGLLTALNCKVSKIIGYITVVICAIFFIMFSNFFLKTYRRQTKNVEEKKKD